MFATLALLATAYGVTLHGGAADRGTAFVVGRNGPETIYSFCADVNCYDGADPVGMIRLSDGSYVGTTTNGGLRDNGVLFRIVPWGAGWTEQVLWHFGTLLNDDDGTHPLGCLTVSNGWIIGLASGGYYEHGVLWEFKQFKWGAEFNILKNYHRSWIDENMSGACADTAREGK